MVARMSRALLVCSLLSQAACVREVYPEPQYEADAGGAGGAASCPADLEPFAIGAHGLTKSDPRTQLSVRVDKANFPPRRGMNDWQIVVTDAAGQPASNAHLSWACTYMPVHGHGKNPRSIERTGDGVFLLSQQNMSMPGPWQVQLWLDPSGRAPEYTPQLGAAVPDGMPCMPSNGVSLTPSVVFTVCVEGPG